MRLDGLSVLDFSLTYPGPYCTQLLADLGADVVSVEPPDGDPTRWLSGPGPGDGVFAALNRGKDSVALDLTDAGDREHARTLAGDADVVVEGFRPGVAERLGVDYATLAERNPGLVYCSVTGFGQTGPRRDDPAHDLTVSALGGFLDMTRPTPNGRPTIAGYSVVDAATGLAAATAILSALLDRELGDGGGAHLDVSMLDALLSVSQSVAPAALAGEQPRPGETPFTGGDPWYDVYETADGAYLAVGAFEADFWAEFCDAIERPELVDAHGTDDPAVKQATREAVAARIRKQSLEEWLAALDDVDTAVEPVQSLMDTLDSDHVRARDTVRGRESESPYVGFPVRTRSGAGEEWTRPDVANADVGARTLAPALNEHDGRFEADEH